MPTKRLLCVDDDDATLQSRKLLLEASGYSVLTTNSPQDALNILARGAPIDLVLLDYVMPDMNGDQFARTLRDQYPELPLMVVSAFGQLPNSLRQSVDTILQKGQDPQVFLASIAAVLERSNQKTAQSPVHRTVLCVDDEELQLEARRLLFESAGYHVLEADSAQTALQIFDSCNIDAVVLDYWLSSPGGNGTILAEQMKRKRPKVPIVMLSGFTSLPGEQAVVDSWMRKGLEPESLIREVERLIELRSLPPSTTAHPQ